MRMTRIAVAFLMSIVALAGTTAQDKPEPPPRKYTFGSMGVALRADLTIYQGGGKDAEGKIVVGNGDRLLKFSGKDLKTLDDFCRALYATKPGEEVEVNFERTIPDTKEKQTLTAKIKLGDPKFAYANLYAHKDRRNRSFDCATVLAAGGSSRERISKEVAQAKLEAGWDGLLAAHGRELDLWDCYETTTACETLLRDPLAAESLIRWVTEGLAVAEWKQSAPAVPFGRHMANLADLDVVPGETRLPEAGLDPIRLALHCLDLGKRPDPSLVGEFELAWAGQPGFDKCVGTVQEMRKASVDWPDRLHWIDRGLGYAMEALNQKFEAETWPASDFIKTQPREGDNVGVPKWRKPVGKGPAEDGAFVSWDTQYGIVAVGGRGKNTWRCSVPERFAFILDLGGDDEYIDCASTHLVSKGYFESDGTYREGPRTTVSVVIDLGGNDRYRSTGKWGVGAGVMGTAVIFDADGDDTYECPEWGIGAAFGGIGLVIDAKGNDRYMGGRNTIGCAAYGFGGVIDLEGNDVFDSHEYSIGVGHPGGVGFVLDRVGDERYRCTGKVPSGYGTKGEFSGWGIGCGFGWRTLAAGGTGLVVDCAGNDIYDAGEFGLGCGYFLGVGMVRDMGGDDIYHSSRYGLATAAHCAVGLFMDDAGNDVYVGKTAASMAGVWDIAVGYFHEGGGNDVYRCDGLGLGASAQNGVGIFWEAGGDDVYQCGDSCLGYGGAAEYAGGRLARNFGLFFDLGGNDTYPGAPKNKSKTWAQEYGLFVDE